MLGRPLALGAARAFFMIFGEARAALRQAGAGVRNAQYNTYNLGQYMNELFDLEASAALPDW